MQHRWFRPEPVEYVARIGRGVWGDPTSTDAIVDAAAAMGARAVMPFTTESLDPQHPDLPAVRDRAAEMARVFATAADRGIDVEVNMYSTQGHTPRRTECEFDWVVGETGDELVSIPCPLGESFRSYLTRAYGVYAETFGSVVWIDDDLRLDNHAGARFECFCDSHLARFADRTGRSWTIDETARLLRRPPAECSGVDIEARVAWRAIQAEGLAELCGLLADAAAVHGAEIARMTPGGYAGHLRTGADFNAELRALSRATELPRIRMGGAVYSDDVPLDNLRGQLRMDADTSTLTEPCRPATEIDTFPGYPGRKSTQMLMLEMTTATAGWGADHTLAIFPGMRRFEPDGHLYGELARHRDVLTTLRSGIAALIDAGGRRFGVSQPVPVDPVIAARRDLTVGADLPWNFAFAKLGLPINPHTPQVVIADLDTVTSRTDDQLAELLRSAPVVLTAEAYEQLLVRHVLADETIGLSRFDDPPVFEAEQIAPPGRDQQRAMLWFYAQPDARYRLDAKQDGTVWATQVASDGTEVPSLVVAEPWDGIQLAVTTHQPGELRDAGRQDMFQRLVSALAPRPPVTIESALNVYPIQWTADGADIVVLTNYGHYDYHELRVRFPRTAGKVSVLGWDAQWAPHPHQPDAAAVRLDGLDSVALRIEWA